MKKYCVIGHPITHSKSPQLHDAGFIDMEIDASFDAIDVLPEDLGNWVKNQFRPEFQGAAVTIPHKQAIIPYLDFQTEAAKKVVAVNTLFWQNDTLGGTNTDVIGVLRALSTETDPAGKKALVLGAGGAARAAVYALKSANATVYIWNRTTEKARQLANEYAAIAIDSADLSKVESKVVDIVLNMTSVGLRSHESILPSKFWRPHHIAFDAVYEPLETRFLFEAEQAGARTITGDKMLVFQALEQFRIWHGMELEPEIMGNAFFNE